MKPQTLLPLILSFLASVSYAKERDPIHRPHKGSFIVPCVYVDCTKICSPGHKQYNRHVCFLQCDNDESKPICGRRGRPTTTITEHETTTMTSFVVVPTELPELWIGTGVPSSTAA